MLHVRDGNAGAHRLYQRLGFEVRRLVTVVIVRFDGP
jgi:predicted GNAT family acetyltransferase